MPRKHSSQSPVRTRSRRAVSCSRRERPISSNQRAAELAIQWSRRCLTCSRVRCNARDSIRPACTPPATPAEVHWANNNYFIHYGGAGLDMFQMVGYDPVHDADYLQQSPLGFEFDDVARRASIAALNEHIPRRVYANDAGISFGELFATTCNSSPASAQIYRQSIGTLLDEQVLQIVGADGTKRRSSAQIKDSDQIMSPPQRTLFTAI